MNEHIVTAFTGELEQLSATLLRMGGIAEKMILDACAATVRGDLTSATEVISRDREVDEIEADVERRIMEIVARRQPLARDLREVLAALKSRQ